MHLLNRASDKTASLNTVLDCISKSFESSSEELKFNFYDGVTNINPLFGFCFTRDALAASQSIVEKFVERNDPRGTRAFMDRTGYNVKILQRLTPHQTGSLNKCNSHTTLPYFMALL